MQTVGAFEAKRHFSALLERVKHGAHVVITKHGHPVAVLMPISGRNKASKKEAIVKIKKLASKHTLGNLNWKKLRDEGRR